MNKQLLLSFVISLLLLFNLSGELSAQTSPNDIVRVEVSDRTLALGEQLTLTIIIVGNFNKILPPKLSNLSGFREVGRSSSHQISIINGQMMTEQIHLYQLQPLHEGHLTIPPLTINLDSSTIETEPINIVVTPSQKPLAPQTIPSAEDTDFPPGPYFVEAEVDITTPYFGQQVIYTFRLYQTNQYISDAQYEDPAFTDFWNQTIIDRPHYKTVIAGRTYWVNEIRTAIFPASLGIIDIAPAQLIIPGPLQPDEIYESLPVTVTVRSLPDPAPDSFKGAVGQYTIQAYLTNTEAKVDEPISLMIELEGFGNIEVLNEPDLPDLDSWRVFDAKSSTQLATRKEGVFGLRRFERLLIPTQAGQYEIPAIAFSYYDPKTESYHTLHTNPIPITVVPANDSATVSNFVPNKSVGRGIRAIKPPPISFVDNNITPISHPFYWICWFLPTLVIGGAWGAKRWYSHRQQRLAEIQPGKAYRTAQQILITRHNQQTEPHKVAHQALVSYLSDQLKRPITGITRKELLSLIISLTKSNDLASRTEAILIQIDNSRFAPGGLQTNQTLITDTGQLIDDLEHGFNS